MLKKNLISILFLLVIGTLALTVYLYFNQSETKGSNTAFIENAKVFEEFEMKKDYDKLIEKELAADQLTLDSLGLILESFSKVKNPNDSELNKAKKDYYINQKLLEKKFSELSQKYTNEVYVRLNSYIKEYGKKKGYDFILGANGQGNVMYVAEKKDVTNDLISYINNKYKN